MDAERVIVTARVERGELAPRERLAHLRELLALLGARPHNSLRLGLSSSLFTLWREAPPDLVPLVRAELLAQLSRLEMPPEHLLQHPSLRLREDHLRYQLLLVAVEQLDVAEAHVAAFAADPDLHEQLRESLERNLARLRRFRETGEWAKR